MAPSGSTRVMSGTRQLPDARRGVQWVASREAKDDHRLRIEAPARGTVRSLNEFRAEWE